MPFLLRLENSQLPAFEQVNSNFDLATVAVREVGARDVGCGVREEGAFLDLRPGRGYWQPLREEWRKWRRKAEPRTSQSWLLELVAADCFLGDMRGSNRRGWLLEIQRFKVRSRRLEGAGCNDGSKGIK
jgi:hypothetical protein